MAHGPCTILMHFNHTGHRLEKLNANTEYLCHGCKTLGYGSSFRCTTCNFDLHEYCGQCPGSLTSFMHQHPLSLLVRQEQGTRTNDRSCNVCRESVEGLFYWCEHCNFNVHPICTQLPQRLRHALHPAHRLTLQASNKVGCCGVCRGVCDSWRYMCGTCNDVDIHFECVLVPCDMRSKHGPSPSPQAYGGYGYGGGAYGSSPYHHNMYNGANYGYGGGASGSSPYHHNMYNGANYGYGGVAGVASGSSPYHHNMYNGANYGYGGGASGSSGGASGSSPYHHNMYNGANYGYGGGASGSSPYHHNMYNGANYGYGGGASGSSPYHHNMYNGANYGYGGVASGSSPYHHNMYNGANYGYGGGASGSSPYHHNMYNGANYGYGGVASGSSPYHHNMYNGANYGYGGGASGSNPYNMYNAAHVNYQVQGYNGIYDNFHQAQGGGATNGRPGIVKMMYGLVKQIALGVATDVIFGFPLDSLLGGLN